MANAQEAVKAISSAPQVSGLQQLIEKSAKELGRALPDHLRPERLVRIALTCIRLNPELTKCTPESFLGALFTAAQLGLEPVAGRAYLLPFNNSRKIGNEWKTIKEVQFIVGYKGLADLFYRHEKAVQLEWGIYQKGDEFDYQMGTDAYIKHKPSMTDRGEPLAYYVIATLKNGGKVFHVMSHSECMEHGKKHSKTFDKKTGNFFSSSPWFKTPDSMCLKTVLIQLAKLLPLSIELQKAIAADETSREFRNGIDDAFDLPDTTNWENKETIPAEVVDDGTAQEPNDGEVLVAKS